MKLKVLSVSAALCVSILMAGARAGAAEEVQPLDPQWLRQMYEEGWHKLQEGVLQRDTGGGQLETFSYGDEGLSWVVQSLEKRSRLLENRHASSPSNELAGTIDRLRDEIARLNVLAQDVPSSESFDGEALESCSPSYGGTATASPLPHTPGVTAQASAYFHSACSQLGDTYAYTYAHVTNGSTGTSTTQDDLKNAETWLDSSATVSLQGSKGCESRAQAMVTSDELSISYMTPEATNYLCPPPWAAAYPPDTQMGMVSEIPAGPRPAYLMPMTENTNPSFGTQITRITDQVAFGYPSTTTVIRHHYSKTQPWNADGTRIMLSSKSHPLLDGNDYHIVRPTNIFSASARWSHKDPNKLFHASADKINQITIDPLDDSQTATVLRSFPGYSDLSIGNHEGNLSIDDGVVALMGRKTTGPNGLDDLYVIIYDIQNDAVLSETRFDNKFSTAADSIDWVSVSQSGNYVVFNWAPDGTARYQGMEVYQVVNGALVFMRQLSPVSANGDLGYDSFGNEVYVQADFDDPANLGVSLSSFRLDNGARVTQLLQGGPNGTDLQANHVSCRNYKRPGWAYISTQDQKANLLRNSKEVLAVKLDGSLTVERFGWTHNHYFNYDSAVHPVPNPDGTKVMFASNWDGTSSADPVYSYVAEWPQPPTVNGLLKENFEDGLANGWTPAGGTWSIVPDSTMGNHALRQSSTTAGAFSVSTPNFIGGTDYAIQARIKINAFGSNGSVQLHARYKDASNYYYLLANAYSPNPEVQLKKKYRGVTTTLQVVPFSISTGVWNTLKLQVDGTSIKGYVNGSLMINVTDADLTSGSVRVGGNNVDAKFDDVVVSMADDFEDGNANGWIALSGTWSVMTDGSGVLTQSDPAAAQFNAYRGSSSWTNYGIQARIKVMTFGSSGSAMLRVRFTDVYNNYYLVLNGTQAVLKRKKNGVTTTLSTQPFVANLDTWYKVGLVATGANIEGWIDGIRVISVVDSDPLPGGFAVLAGHNADVRFDDVIVE